ncbi:MULTISPECIES: hypothetical protein [Haloarcula]|uniref:hypothetical protein n=1 Tax=Haloarcula TaxID=2237 RepID=UPI000F8DFC50|nr:MULTISPECIES: hypothetical protein [Haloarcula]NHX41403.1 hypothetical protein [Haloarcula sp. R1-2]
MTEDADMVECEYCGEKFKSAGLGTHQRFCDAVDADESDDEEEENSFREDVIERDDGACLVCGNDDFLVAHVVDESEPDELVNRLTLCERCDMDLDGLHPMTKRTKAHH